MTKLQSGHIYLLANALWDSIELKKIGVSNDTQIRIKGLSTALPDEINKLFESNILIDKYFYEHMVSKMLYKYRYSSNREFYKIDIEDFKKIITMVETINRLYNDEESLLEFIKNYDLEYYKRRFNRNSEYIKRDIINKVIKRKKQSLYVCTVE